MHQTEVDRARTVHQTEAERTLRNEMQLFEGCEIRSLWSAEDEDWYFSIVDVIAVLTESKNPQAYWRVLKKRLFDEGNQTVTNCNGLKMKAPDGKMRITDVGTTEQILRLVQIIPSPKAEPFKLWLAKVGKERIDETFDPELAIERAIGYYRQKDYTEEWISQRLCPAHAPGTFAREEEVRGTASDFEYAILTNDIYRAWSEMSAREYRDFKGLTKESLRDNTGDMEPALTTLAETTTAGITRSTDSETRPAHREVANTGGEVVGIVRKAPEERIGHPAITEKTAPNFGRILSEVIEAQSLENKPFEFFPKQRK